MDTMACLIIQWEKQFAILVTDEAVVTVFVNFWALHQSATLLLIDVFQNRIFMVERPKKLPNF